MDFKRAPRFVLTAGILTLFVGGLGCNNEQSNRCGNARQEAHEECDDGNAINWDGCSRSCQVEPELFDVVI